MCSCIVWLDRGICQAARKGSKHCTKYCSFFAVAHNGERQKKNKLYISTHADVNVTTKSSYYTASNGFGEEKKTFCFVYPLPIRNKKAKQNNTKYWHGNLTFCYSKLPMSLSLSVVSNFQHPLMDRMHFRVANFRHIFVWHLFHYHRIINLTHLLHQLC